MPARRHAKPTSAHLAGRRWRVALRLGLLLALVAPGAHAFEEPAPEAQHDSAFDSAAMPTAANWVVLDATGTTAWRAQGETRWRQFTLGEVLPLGCEIETGPDGQVTLVAGGDQLIVGSQGRLIVPLASPGEDRHLRHERGRILVHIESRRDRDVRVNTPLLSLGIKGTNFEVEVDPEQNSVVVHDGQVEVTTPTQPDPVDLGAGEGLRQPAAPGSQAMRFTLPARAAPSSAVTEPTPGPPSRADGAANETATNGRHGSPAGVRTETRSDSPSGRSTRSGSHSAGPLGWLDDWASSWTWIVIGGAALLFLTIPALALIHHLRDRWQGRPASRGRRRRELVRG
jgi:FecR protein